MQLTLDIDPASDPIAGTLQDARGRAVEFSGWLGFAGAIDQLLAGAGRSEHDETGQLTGDGSGSAPDRSAADSSSRE